MLRMIKLNNLLRKMLTVGIALGYFYIIYYYYKGYYFSLNIFITVIATVLLLVPSLFLILGLYYREMVFTVYFLYAMLADHRVG